MIGAPEYFVRLLNGMDPLLDVRWGGHVGRWVIDRVAVTPVVELKYLIKRRERETRRCATANAKPSDHTKLSEINEEIESMTRVPARRVILYADALDTKIYEALCLADMQRYGGYSRYADEIEAAEAEAEAEQDKRFTALLDDMGREVIGLGNGSTSVYDFIVNKRAGELDKLRVGTTSLRQLLGLAQSAPLLGAGGDAHRHVTVA